MADSASVRGVLADLKIDAAGLRGIGMVHLFRAEPDRLLPLWRRLRGAHERSGLWPLILGTDRDIEDLGRSFGRDLDHEVARGLAMDVTARLAELRAGATSWTDDGDAQEIPPRGETGGLRPHDEDAFVLAGKPGWIGLVTVSTGYVVPGMLTWPGAANYDIGPADHVAILKYWHGEYGAELVGLGLDTIELWVPHPPVHAGTTCEQDWPAMPQLSWSAGEWLLPY
ncbi:MAG: DUF4253 domain-containing protein [Streptosporangiaceae bacterium]